MWGWSTPVLISLLIAIFLLAGWASWELTSLIIEE